MTGAQKYLRDQWHLVRDKVLAAASERVTTNADLRMLSNIPDEFDEGKLLTRTVASCAVRFRAYSCSFCICIYVVVYEPCYSH